MKKLFCYFAIILTFLLSLSTLHAEDVKPYAFTFTGRWQPAEDPVLIEGDGYQDIQNMRPDGKRLHGINGSSKINSSVWDSTNDTPIAGYHYKKEALKSNYTGYFGQTAGSGESHVLIHAKKDDSTATAIYENETAIPGTGDFNASAVYTFNEYSTPARFSPTPRGELAIANGDEALVWGGDETFITSFITSTAGTSLTDPKDFSEAVTNKNRDTEYTAQVGSENDSYCKLLLHMDGTDGSTTFTDSSASSQTVTAGNDTELDTADRYFGTASALFDGTGDYLRVTDSDDFATGTQNFTFEGWFRFNNGIAGSNPLYFFRQYVDADNYQIFTADRSVTGVVKFIFEVKWLTSTVISETFPLNDSVGRIIDDGEWHHIALVRGYGSAGASVTDNIAVFVDGYVITSAEDSSSIGNLAADMDLLDNDTQDFDGWADEIRWSKSICRFPANFVPPVRPYGTEAKHWFIGSTKPLNGLKYYLNQVNPISATISAAKEWQGSKWVNITLTDNTTGLSASGTTTWTATGKARVKVMAGLSLYWYRFTLSDGGASIYYVSGMAPMQAITNVWDGEYLPITKFKAYNGSIYTDFTREVQSARDEWADYIRDNSNGKPTAPYPFGNRLPGWDQLLKKKKSKEYTLEVQSEETAYYADISSLSTSGTLELGFIEPMQGFLIKFVAGQENSTAGTDATIKYWDGNSFSEVSGMTDNTAAGGISFAQTGTITFTPLEEGFEFKRDRNDDFPLYYYSIQFDAALDASVQVYQILGIPAPKKVRGFSFPARYQNRLFFFDERDGRRNIGIYSAYNAGYIFNGDDSGELYFGGDEAITAAANIFNVYRTTGFDQLIVTKKYETYRLFGFGPEDWEVQPLSTNVGCVAPLSMAVADLEDTEAGTTRQVAIWQSAHGVVMSDGAAVIPISDDIKVYWDPTDTRFIPTNRQDDSVGWYDSSLQVYKLLVSSGSGQTTHNLELEYSLKYKSWTKIYRQNGGGSPAAEPLLIGFQVTDTDGSSYSYGAPDGGYMYRLENGKMFDGDTAIPQYVTTKRLLLDNEMPFFKHTLIQYIRTMFEPKTSAGSADNVTITHYCDGSQTIDGVSGQEAPAAFAPETNYFNTQDVTLGLCLMHAFKFSATVDQYDDGIELLGFGLYYWTQDEIVTD